MSRLGLPSEYDYWLREYSPNIPLKSITTISHPTYGGFRRALTVPSLCFRNLTSNLARLSLRGFSFNGIAADGGGPINGLDNRRVKGRSIEETLYGGT